MMDTGYVSAESSPTAHPLLVSHLASPNNLLSYHRTLYFQDKGELLYQAPPPSLTALPHGTYLFPHHPTAMYSWFLLHPAYHTS